MVLWDLVPLPGASVPRPVLRMTAELSTPTYFIIFAGTHWRHAKAAWSGARRTHRRKADASAYQAFAWGSELQVAA